MFLTFFNPKDYCFLFSFFSSSTLAVAVATTDDVLFPTRKWNRVLLFVLSFIFSEFNPNIKSSSPISKP
ncbi:hypothetical protein ES288_D08G095400v1 [Gossypium darwinii]|uniref:Uncharacterized protein n=1 Tax=Gossypium darwinii TaxID=34276 RepID=A0A5D2BHE3_GOSDA|nr:hypothetical protein ES288_D08G095400v1 [Gossypium darwinii]